MSLEFSSLFLAQKISTDLSRVKVYTCLALGFLQFGSQSGIAFISSSYRGEKKAVIRQNVDEKPGDTISCNPFDIREITLILKY
jgi:hypothetical protein